MNACMSWGKAIAVSGIVHLAIILAFGLVLNNLFLHGADKKEVMVELFSAPPADRPLEARQQSAAVAGSYPRTGAVAAAHNKQYYRQTGNAAVNSGEIGAAVSDAPSASAAVAGAFAQGEPAAESAVASTAKGYDLQGFINAFVAELERNKEYPYVSRKRGQEGTVTLLVQLGESGQLNRVEVVSSSGVSRLDEAAVSLVQRVCPFRNGAGKEIAMRIPVNYHLRE